MHILYFELSQSLHSNFYQLEQYQKKQLIGTGLVQLKLYNRTKALRNIQDPATVTACTTRKTTITRCQFSENWPWWWVSHDRNLLMVRIGGPRATARCPRPGATGRTGTRNRATPSASSGSGNIGPTRSTPTKHRSLSSSCPNTFRATVSLFIFVLVSSFLLSPTNYWLTKIGRRLI